jgi:hypothetical protein
MLKSELLRAIQQEIHRHDFSHFVENPPSVAQGGKGVVVPGCPARGLNRRKHTFILTKWVLESRIHPYT